jgi:hypothetical protein
MYDERRPDGRETGRHLDDVAKARHFQRKLSEVRPAERYWGASIEYDESGYPLPDRGPGLAGRIRRLITG